MSIRVKKAAYLGVGGQYTYVRELSVDNNGNGFVLGSDNVSRRVFIESFFQVSLTDREEIRQAAVEVLDKSISPLSPNEIAERTRAQPCSLFVELDALKSEGVLDTIPTGEYFTANEQAVRAISGGGVRSVGGSRWA